MKTLEEYGKMSAFAQGYTTYMEADHEGAVIPKDCIYRQGTAEYDEWHRGNFKAMLEVQDGEE